MRDLKEGFEGGTTWQRRRERQLRVILQAMDLKPWREQGIMGKEQRNLEVTVCVSEVTMPQW